jgi:transglutaminase-like putative cysteine protease
VSATAALPRRATRAHPAGRRTPREWWPATWPMLAFGALALLAGVRFATLLANPPLLRIAGVVGSAAAGGLALSLTSTLPGRRGLATAARVLIAVLSAYLALRASGAPARLLWPWRWGGLASELRHGIDALNGLWPYRGNAGQARAAIIFVAASAIVAAAILAFWPGDRRARTRRAIALCLLLVLYVAAASNESQIGWQVQGTLLLTLLCAWVWAWRGRVHDRGRATAWLLVVVALALVAAGVVESGTPLLDYRDWNPFGQAYSPTTFNWNQAYGPLPWASSAEPMVSVASRAPHLWRAATLARFDGVGFVRSSPQPRGTTGLEGVSLHPRWVTRTTVAVRGLSSRQLLSPGEIIGASVRGETAPNMGAIAADGTLTVSAATPSGDRYTVTAYAPRPSVAEMRRAPSTFPTSDAPYTELELPAVDGLLSTVSPSEPGGAALINASVYAPVYALAHRLAVGASSTYGVAARIQTFFSHGFTYNQHPRGHAFPLIAFLFSERSGYCQQFSGAMTLMLRMDGIPARVAAGFLSGARESSSGRYDVTAEDAHEWVEVFFAGIGWVPFNPTPTSRLAGSYSALALKPEGGAASLRHRSTPSRSRAARHTPAAAVRSSAGTGDGLPLALVIAVGTLALAIGAALAASASKVRRRFTGDAQGGVRELSIALALVGRRPGAGTTLTQLEHELRRSCGPAAGRYVQLLRERRYAPPGLSAAPGARERSSLRRALCRRRGPYTRLRVVIALPPVWGEGRWMLLSRHRRAL